VNLTMCWMYTHFRYSAASTTALLTFALVANLGPLMAVPTVLPEIQSAWGLIGVTGRSVRVPLLNCRPFRCGSE
jgi:hypothetical protein